MINLNDCIGIGQFTRPHSYKGQLKLKLNNIRFDEITEMEWAYVVLDGLPVPFFIQEFTEFSPDTLVVKLKGVVNETQARELCPAQVFVDSTVVQAAPTPQFEPSHLKGYRVVDIQFGYLGLLEQIIEHSLNPLLQIFNNSSEILIPFQDKFVLGIDHSKKELLVKCPEGLIDLNN